MRTAPTFAGVAMAMVRPALRFCAWNLLAAVLAAQCTNPTQVPNQTISSGTGTFSNSNALAASYVTINGSANITFVAGNCIDLQPGFQATAGTAGTTFHAWVEAAPSVVSVSPSSGSGLSQTFTWTVSDPSGYADLTQIQAIFNTTPSGQYGCYIVYNRNSNLLYLVDNLGYWLGGFTPGSGGSASSPQCSIYGNGSSVSVVGNNQLALTVSVTFQPSFAGTKNNYLIAWDQAGIMTELQWMGTWTVAGGQQYSLSTAVNNPGWGTISPASGLYNSGAQVPVAAAPATGYTFLGFSGNLSGTALPQVLAMNGTKTVWANFTPTPQGQRSLTTSVNTSGAGTITPGAGSYNFGQQVQVTASANTGYQFTNFTGVDWYNGTVGYVTMSDNRSVTANYQATSVPDFSLSSRTGSRILAAGRSGQYTISVQPVNGFAGTVSFSAFGLPYGATATFNPPSVAGSGSTTATVSTTGGSVTNNPISITITGTSGSLIRSVTSYLMVNPPGYSIHPTGVEVNLSAVPLDRYLLSNNDGSGTAIISHCPVAYTIRQCIAKLFNNDPGNPIAQGPNGVPVEWNNWVAQGVTGVRFFYGTAGGFWSTPYVPNSPPYSSTHPTIQSGMQPETTWVNNLDAFFQDLRIYGIQRVTPTPVMGDWGWDHGMVPDPTLHPCGNPEVPLYFLPFLPFGLNPAESYFPDRSCADQSYQNGQSPATPDYIFWGWDRFFNLMGAVISRAASNQLIVNTLDYYQETNMAEFTVGARMVYDNTRNVDVVASLQDIMGWYHDNVFSGIDPLGASPSANQPEVPTPVWDDCTSSHYGDSGQLLTLSALVAALKGNKAIGLPGYDYPIGLPCGSLPSGGTDVPPGRRLFPSFIDIHTQKNFNLLTDMADWSKNFYSRMYAFISAPSLSGKRVVFGETNPINVNVPGCTDAENDPFNLVWTKEQAEIMLYGLSGSQNGYTYSTLFQNYAGNVVMRPWQDITHAHSKCIAFPNTINPPFNPMQANP